jgi:hypothetical protein
MSTTGACSAAGPEHAVTMNADRTAKQTSFNVLFILLFLILEENCHHALSRLYIFVAALPGAVRIER